MDLITNVVVHCLLTICIFMRVVHCICSFFHWFVYWWSNLVFMLLSSLWFVDINSLSSVQGAELFSNFSCQSLFSLLMIEQTEKNRVPTNRRGKCSLWKALCSMPITDVRLTSHLGFGPNENCNLKSDYLKYIHWVITNENKILLTFCSGKDTQSTYDQFEILHNNFDKKKQICFDLQSKSSCIW